MPTDADRNLLFGRLIPISKPAERDTLALRAMDALRQSLAAGYADFENIKTDTDLDVLRGRAGFRALIADLAAPKGARQTAVRLRGNITAS